MSVCPSATSARDIFIASKADAATLPICRKVPGTYGELRLVALDDLRGSALVNGTHDLCYLGAVLLRRDAAESGHIEEPGAPWMVLARLTYALGSDSDDLAILTVARCARDLYRLAAGGRTDHARAAARHYRTAELLAYRAAREARAAALAASPSAREAA